MGCCSSVANLQQRLQQMEEDQSPMIFPLQRRYCQGTPASSRAWLRRLLPKRIAFLPLAPPSAGVPPPMIPITLPGGLLRILLRMATAGEAPLLSGGGFGPPSHVTPSVPRVGRGPRPGPGPLLPPRGPGKGRRGLATNPGLARRPRTRGPTRGPRPFPPHPASERGRATGRWGRGRARAGALRRVARWRAPRLGPQLPAEREEHTA